jgi:hypothetical protein
MCFNSSGDALTTLFGSPQMMPKPKHSMLPVLVVLFLFSYGLMTLLIVEQGSTIQAQRGLIHDLLSDTHELAAMKGKVLREQALSRQAQAKNDSQAASDQTPLNQAPSANVPHAQAGSPKAQPKANGKVQQPAPAKPASGLVDVRRNLLSI